MSQWTSADFYAAAWSGSIAASEGRAKQLREHPVLCTACGRQTVVGKRHASCVSGSLAGMRCTCRPGCTDVVWGDGGFCDPDCAPCQLMAGRFYNKP